MIRIFVKADYLFKLLQEYGFFIKFFKKRQKV